MNNKSYRRWDSVRGNLVVNGDFDTDISGWLEGADCTATWDAGTIKVTNDSTVNSVGYQEVTTEVGEYYEYVILNITNGGRITIGASISASEYVNRISLGALEWVHGTYLSVATSAFMNLHTNSSNLGAFREYDCVSLRRISAESFRYYGDRWQGLIR